MMHQKGAIPLTAILQALSEQIDALHARAECLETAVSPLLTQPPRVPDKTIRELQSIDWLRQGLEDIARLTRLLAQLNGADALCADQVAAINDQLSLSSTKALLLPYDAEKVATATSQKQDLHLFDR